MCALTLVGFMPANESSSRWREREKPSCVCVCVCVACAFNRKIVQVETWKWCTQKWRRPTGPLVLAIASVVLHGIALDWIGLDWIALAVV